MSRFVGIAHKDDLIYLFYNSDSLYNLPLLGKDSPKPGVDMIDKLTTIYANFARTGNPIPQKIKLLKNVKWDRYSLKSQKYMDIGNKPTMKEKLYGKRYQLWDSLHPLSFYNGTD
ncbi:hypothetical protein JTB14_016695 [Gonioctena quinquepunctata]|nr:hypothetical protein JTB14_016695 [Gonioctena quinquepunctata]